MRIVSKRDLNHHTAEVLSEVTDGDDVVVTERGRPRWRVSAFRDADTPLARLERNGRYTPPPSEPAPWPRKPGGPTYTDADVESVLGELRGDH